jgi:hypothetical protein
VKISRWVIQKIWKPTTKSAAVFYSYSLPLFRVSHILSNVWFQVLIQRVASFGEESVLLLLREQTGMFNTKWLGTGYILLTVQYAELLL